MLLSVHAVLEELELKALSSCELSCEPLKVWTSEKGLRELVRLHSNRTGSYDIESPKFI